MSHKSYEPWHSFIPFCRTMTSFKQPYQLNLNPMVSKLKMPAYELKITISKTTEESG